MSQGAPLLFEAIAAEVSFGGQRVVSSTTQGQVRDDVLATERKRAKVIKLEVVDFTAALAVLVRVRATSDIAPKDFAPHRRRGVSTALARRFGGGCPHLAVDEPLRIRLLSRIGMLSRIGKRLRMRQRLRIRQLWRARSIPQ